MKRFCQLTVADEVLLLDVGDVEAPHVSRGHALCEGGQAPPGPQPIREPGQVAVAVEAVGVQTTAKKTRKRRETVNLDWTSNLNLEKWKNWE